LRIANPFGGGLGKTGGTCGAVAGAMMVIGLKYGTCDATDEKANARVYELGRKFIQEFRSRNATLICRELLGFDVYTRKKLVSDEERVIFDLCPKYIQDAAEILEGMI
jgi:C_GCAxxG_C_C family probable redox protein